MAVELRNVSKTYVQRGNGSTRRILALAPLSLTVAKGEFFAIIGPSGCGKSSLLNLIAGFERPDTGEVLVEGKRVERPGPDRAVVFQEAGLMPWMTVLGNVEYGLKLRGIPKTERRERAMHFLKMVHLSKYAHALPHELSGGMRQRVSIARALALEPNVLLMDEPFSALDAQTRDVLHDELQRIWFETHVTIIFVTHNINEAVYLADRVLIMTAPPGSIKRLVRVPFARPRVSSSADLRVFAGQLHTSIREEVEKVAAREFDEDWTPELQVRPTPDPASGI
ncbi:MAG: ABC transporter ATP-binding protein [Candidatus Sumerlaea chitinivorans]|nr:ABC transporter ATP-binding protein [Candidatus Sumerlaea chitinivorans]